MLRLWKKQAETREARFLRVLNEAVRISRHNPADASQLVAEAETLLTVLRQDSGFQDPACSVQPQPSAG